VFVTVKYASRNGIAFPRPCANENKKGPPPLGEDPCSADLRQNRLNHLPVAFGFLEVFVMSHLAM
jgi:hypothetical protein